MYSSIIQSLVALLFTHAAVIMCLLETAPECARPMEIGLDHHLIAEVKILTSYVVNITSLHKKISKRNLTDVGMVQ